MSAKQGGFLGSGTRQAIAACALAAALLLPLGTGSVGATRLDHRGTAQEQQACTPDVFRLCMSAIPNEPRILACLIRSKRQLSPACRMVFDRGSEQPERRSATRKSSRSKAVRQAPPRKSGTRPRAARRADRR